MKYRVGLIVAVLVGLLTSAAAIGTPAHSATYRFWSYWIGGDSWEYSNRGPAFRSPPDGGVEGWHFAVSADSGSTARPPTAQSSYDQLCPGAAPAAPGSKRVAVVLDFGSAGEAPLGERPPNNRVECVQAPESATGLQVLQSVTTMRFHTSGLICGIDGYPATECPTPRAAATPTAAPTRSAPPVVATPAPVTPGSAPSRRIPKPADTPVTQPTPETTTPAPPRTRRPTPSWASAQPVTTGDQTSPPVSPTGPPGWLTATGVAMIAGLAGLAILIGRQRP